MINKMDEYKNETMDFINEYLNNLDINERLKESMLYSINAGGKRLRPSLLLGVFESYNKNCLCNAIPYASAIEMIHTYSLIHDDLPAMDNDELRRGVPTNHIMFGEDLAILAGDGLLNAAHEIMIDKITNEGNKKAALIISECAGPKGMIGGQAYDINGANDFNDLVRIHKLKTGALIRASVLAGGYIAEVDKSVMIALENYATELGIAFQIQDDILDVIGNVSELGKPIFSDEKNEKMTYVSLFGIEEAKRHLNNRTESAINYAKSIKNNFLVEVANLLKDRSN